MLFSILVRFVFLLDFNKKKIYGVKCIIGYIECCIIRF